MDHVILILSTDGFMKIEFLTNLECFEDLINVPVTGSPIKSFSIFNDIMKSSASFLYWGALIIAMSINNVHVVHLESFKGALNCLSNMLPTGSSVRIDKRLRAYPNFRSNYKVFSLLPDFLENPTKNLFSFPKLVKLSSIKVINAMLQT